MEYTKALIPLIDGAYARLFRQAEVLELWMDYQVTHATRSPQEMLLECVTIPVFLTAAIKRVKMPEIDEDTFEMEEFASIQKCQETWEQVKPDLFSAIQNFPQEKLLEEIQSPWGTFPWRDFIAYCYWNPMWHAGQMAYIQMIHGDEQFH